MLEAVLWERACSVRKGRQWKTVVDEMISNFDKTWPSILCTIDQAAAVAVSLTPEALAKRFQRLQSKKTRADGLRSKALKVIAQTQLYAPPLGTPLWNYFRPAENTIISKGSLAQKEAALDKGRKAKRQQLAKSRLPSRKGRAHGTPKSAATTAPDADSADSPRSPCPPTTPATEAAHIPAAPGLKRGGKGGRGRGGALQHATKLVIRDMLVEDGIPAKDIPKALVDVYVLIMQWRNTRRH